MRSISNVRATIAIERASALITPAQLEVTQQFLGDLLRDTETARTSLAPARGMILFAGTDPGITRTMQRILRQCRAQLADLGIAYIDQRDFRRFDGGHRWSSVQGISKQQTDPFVHSLSHRLTTITDEMPRVDTVLISHDAFAGIANGGAMFSTMPPISSRAVRQIRGWVRARNVDVVLATRVRPDRFPAMYATYANRGGVVDPEFLLPRWRDPTQSIVDSVVATGAARRDEIQVDTVNSPTDVIVGLGRVHAGLAETLLPLDPGLATPFRPPRSVRASQILARMNRHRMPAERREACEAFVSADLDTDIHIGDA